VTNGGTVNTDLSQVGRRAWRACNCPGHMACLQVHRQGREDTCLVAEAELPESGKKPVLATRCGYTTTEHETSRVGPQEIGNPRRTVQTTRLLYPCHKRLECQ
jgi:hypothetical protein